MALNGDLITCVSTFLPLDEMIKVRRVNSVWREAIHSDQVFWKKMYCDRYLLNELVDEYESVWPQWWSNETVKPSKVDWLDKLLSVVGRIPTWKSEEQIKGECDDWKEVVKRYNNPFDPHPKFSEYHFTERKEVFLETVTSYQFKDNTNSEEILRDRFLLCSIIDALTSIGYKPNLLRDDLRYKLEVDNNETMPLFTLLVCFLRLDIGDILADWLCKFLVNNRKFKYRLEIGLNIEGEFWKLLDLARVSYYLEHDIKKLRRFGELHLEFIGLGVVKSYFNAGGGCFDIVSIDGKLDENDRRILHLKKTFLRQYY